MEWTENIVTQKGLCEVGSVGEKYVLRCLYWDGDLNVFFSWYAGICMCCVPCKN